MDDTTQTYSNEDPGQTYVPPAADIHETEARGEERQVFSELSQLANKIAAAVQTAWDSEERHKAEDEIRKALRTAGDRIESVADDVRSSSMKRDIQDQATRAAEAMQKNDFAQQVRRGVLSGLRRLNEELDELLEKNKVENATRSAGDAAAAAGKAAAEAGENVADKATAFVKDAGKTATEWASAALKKVERGAHDAGKEASRVAEDVAGSASDAAKDAKRAVEDAGTEAKRTAEDWVEEAKG